MIDATAALVMMFGMGALCFGAGFFVGGLHILKKMEGKGNGS